MTFILVVSLTMVNNTNFINLNITSSNIMFYLCMLERCRKLITLPGGNVVPVEEAVTEEVYDLFEGKFQIQCRVIILLLLL